MAADRPEARRVRWVAAPTGVRSRREQARAPDHPQRHNRGPRRGDVFATSNFARQIAKIEAGRHEAVIHVGNLAARRDYTDVRDIIRGYWLLLQQGEPGEVYNLASGRALAIQEILDFLLGESR